MIITALSQINYILKKLKNNKINSKNKIVKNQIIGEKGLKMTA